MTHRKVLVFWLPLALAWLLMSTESAWIQAVISRKSNAETQLAAYGLMFSLSILIETPIIMLLATSNALARDQQSFRLLWRFMIGINCLITAMALLMAFTPLLDFYLGTLLNVPAHVVEATRPGMKIIFLWGAVIGYRRFHQGVLIRSGNTRYVGYGTILRVFVSGSVAMFLGAITTVSGTEIGALALVLAVVAEAIYTYRVSRADVNRLLETKRPPTRPPLSYRQVTRFHLPLAVTSLITMLANPAIERGLSSMPDAVQSLAAWPIILSIVWFMRAGGMAYQEVVISLNDNEQRHRLLRNFTLRLGLGLSLIMLLFTSTPLVNIYLNVVLGVSPDLQALVIVGAQAAFLLPLLTTLHSYLRALLMLSNRTAAIYQAISFGFALTALVVWGGIALGLHGILAAAFGLTLGQTFELAYLYLSYRRGKDALRLHWQSALAAT